MNTALAIQRGKTGLALTSLSDDHRALEPPDSIPNSEVKRCIADGSVGLPHVRVGHRQAPNRKPRSGNRSGFFLCRFDACGLCFIVLDAKQNGIR